MSKSFKFSNFQELEIPFQYQGLWFKTVEHFYAAMKTKDFQLRMKIANMDYPAQAKKYAAAIPLRPDWNDIKLDVMEYGLRKKFLPGTKHLEDLLAHTEDIVEWNKWHDNFWGECLCNRCQARPEVIAQNNLGKLLMKLRDEYV